MVRVQQFQSPDRRRMGICIYQLFVHTGLLLEVVPLSSPNANHTGFC